MSNAKRVDAKERENIVSLLREHGGNRNKVAKLSKRGPATIQRIAEAEGIVSEYSAPEKANTARRDYALAERLELLNEGFDKAREILTDIKEAADLQRWFIAIATGIDKRRLEDGEATFRGESHNYDHSEELESYFNDLDAFRESHRPADTEKPVDTSRPNGKTA